ncbi:beta-galactosidase [Paenibacillus mucilaginosus]|uniref:Beta-galactosidase n=1 Tax=Paenibacillus mucilaginosus (strain KNP414) TaxID=1036673 RepID=F8FFZ9_PAEMK|nr:beta-galactosidase [Paenibacillus mucilaginosus]AEI43261.1 Beta-galactosidase [Paenibacillus mucilaginosus KNP414]MCG7212184.1 beta-galactosidase [Paenibacillus mucilaginosus]WDM24848.1 beta-galactosidase [Paenibacillus mucilaginosus]
MTAVRFGKIRYGGDYNPEQFPREIWDEDMKLFGEAGIDIATVNVFSWALNQPDEDTYRFEWLDEVLDLLHASGVEACLGTGTAAHPAWMARKYPDILAVTYDGKKRKFGRRHNSCPHSPAFRRFGPEMARRLAERYRDHPAVSLWHVNNEIGIRCYCVNCEAAFREWLKQRYGTLDALNSAWYTRFWGHTYYDWEDIVLPSGLSEGMQGGNSDQTAFQGMTLDYYRFNSDSWLECYLLEARAIKSIIPDAVVTTNFQGNGTYKPLDYFRWAPHLDVIALDMYPENSTPASVMALRYDLMRGLKGGEPFLLMESTPSVINWKTVNPAKPPGVMRLRSWQAVARGADSVMFFQLRRSLGAYEKFHGAVIDHCGHGNTRVFRECTQLGEELHRLGGRLPGARTENRVALIFDWDNWWAVEMGGGPSAYLKYVEVIQHYYDALFSSGIGVDLIPLDGNYERYDLVLAPLLYMVKPGIAEKLEAYVGNGGTLAVSFYSGIADEHDRVVPGGYPGKLRRLLGLWVEEIDALFPDQRNGLRLLQDIGGMPKGDEHACGLVCEVVHPEGAETVGVFTDRYYRDAPALTRHRFGRGEAWYTATRPDPAFMREWLRHLCEGKGIRPIYDGVTGVEVTRRERDGKAYTFLLNHSDEPREVHLGSAVQQDLLSGARISGTAVLPAQGVLILGAEEGGDGS